MGWTWALAVCQQIVESAIDDGGLDPLRRVTDITEHRPLSRDGYLHAQYVDNVVVMGCREEVVNQAIYRAVAALHRHNLITHGAEAAATSVCSLGLSFEDGIVSVSPQRRWRLRLAIEEILRLNVASKSIIEKVMGHYMWAAMLRRESLCVGNALYAFGRAADSMLTPLWPAAARELC